MPISEKTAMKIFMVSRTAYSVVVVNVASRCGCLIWTAMNSSPPTTADRPAARVSLVVVMVMSAPGGPKPATSAAERLEPRDGRGERASPNDVTDWVRCGAPGRLEQAAEHR